MLNMDNLKLILTKFQILSQIFNLDLISFRAHYMMKGHTVHMLVKNCAFYVVN